MARPLRLFVGKTPAQRAIFRKSERYGPYVLKGHGFKRKPVPNEIRQELLSIIGSGKQRHHNVETYSRMRSIMDILEKYPKVPTAMHLAQSLAYEHGLKSEVLLPWLNSADALQRRFKGRALLFEGTLANLCRAVRNGTPEKVERVLLDNARAFSTIDLCGELNTSQVEMSTSLNLLDAMGLVRKLPPRSEGHGGQPYIWVHSSSYRRAEGALPPNFSLRLLQSLKGSSKTFSELGFPKSEAADVNRAMDKLVDAGLVETKTVKHNNIPTRQFRATPTAQTLLTEQAKMQYMHPELRVRLLGRKVLGLKPHEFRILQRVIRYFRVHMDYASMQKYLPTRSLTSGLRKGIAARQGLSVSLVKGIRSARHFPLRNFSLESVRTTYLPAIKMVDENLGRWLEAFIETNPRIFKPTTSHKWLRKQRPVISGELLKAVPASTFGEELVAHASRLLDEGRSNKKVASKTGLPISFVKNLRAERIEQFKRDAKAGKYGTPNERRNIAGILDEEI